MTTLQQRLSALDASFLYIERPGFPMHVGSVARFEGDPLRDRDGSLRVPEIRSAIAARLPENAYWRLGHPYGRGRPYWIEDTSFRLADHVLFTRVEHPGGEHELFDLTARLHERLLDRRRPLWELWIVDGLADGTVAIVEKMHHALVDGLGGVDLATATLDLERNSPEPTPTPRPAPYGTSRATLTALEAAERAGVLLSIRAPNRWGDLVERGRGVRRFVDGLGPLLSDPLAPPSPLNVPVGSRRALAAFRCSLDDARAVKKSLGGTINDVALATVSGALRDVLAEPAKPLHALVPVSERGDGHRGAAGNHVAALIVTLPVDEPDRQGRYDRVAAATAALKGSGESRTTSSLLRAAEVLPEPVAVAVARQVHRQPFVNVVVTNVPGPPLPLYFRGAQMLDAIPVVPLAGNLSLSIGILSYDGQLAIGLFADAARWPDPTCFVAALEQEFRALLDHAQPHTHQEAS